MTRPLIFTKPILVYVPCFNCAGSAAQVIRQIPDIVARQAEVLLVDNHSPDDTGPVVALQLQDSPAHLPIRIIRTHQNLGYSGSQKLAYQLALACPLVEHIIMLHGDGQYPPELTANFLPFRDAQCDVTYGYRSKTRYPFREETPLLTFAAVRLLSIVESLATRVFRKEWHSGFVMYSSHFLRRVPFQVLTETPHIDGHLLYASSRFGARVKGMPIFKRYKNLKAFDGDERVHYVYNVLRLMFRFNRTDMTGISPQPLYTSNDFEIIV